MIEAVFFTLFSLIVYRDIRERRIPNHLVGALLLLALVKGYIEKVALTDIALGFFVCAGILYFLYNRGLTGAGDVKLAAVMGAYLGANTAILSILAGSVLAVIYSALIMYKKGVFKDWVVLNQCAVLTGPKGLVEAMEETEKLTMPRAAFMLAGILMTKGATLLSSL